MTPSRGVLAKSLVVLTALVLAGCGGAPGNQGNQATREPSTRAPATGGQPTADEGPGAVDNLDDVEGAVVQILAEGSFEDPEFGEVSSAGVGSGFVIDPSGIAVTNNHGVTGAALLQIFVAGEDEPRNARVLGVSECSDLAVIDIEGDDYPYLDWYEGDIGRGLDVYTAGFPDPFGEAPPTQFTLKRGIVAVPDADGETQWASVDSVIEHDAQILGGNSGGPLVDENGAVVGINYASIGETDQYYAVGREEALEVIDQLRDGEDVTSIGINGYTVADDQGNTGVWVAGVESGSPADVTGIQGGDILTELEGQLLGDDGTMADYCDVLRSRSADDTMSVEVFR